ncbi:Putative large ribosomal subunit protein bL9/RNase H1 [Colletotrichum destructivum]|uniref:Ribonuclease H n=1 Tax=Colletotrichum destructivum TaxID=34406 RepID=A0AAX4IEI3_9PEZI|nr:Putative large ribosomal subunit protein bL9/RNase H1 [Colletotrichum destructivum]
MRLQAQAPWTKATDLFNPRARATTTTRRLPLPPILIRRRAAAFWQGRPDDRDRTLQLLSTILNDLYDMPANKRGAPSSNSTSSKKRRTDKDVQKYYAVRTGARPGIYLTWAECQKQTAGFRGAQYKSFLTREDAQAFVEGKKIPSEEGEEKPLRFYAVARGIFTGIFMDWGTASLAIAGTKGPKYKKFDTYEDALDFIREWGDEQTIAIAEKEARRNGMTVPSSNKTFVKAEKSEDTSDSDDDSEQSDDILSVEPETKIYTQVYTDGSSLGNGTAGSVAGVGVYFGPNDPRNVSERLEGELQTNQRAELTAILRAFQLSPLTQPIEIVTDSKYSIKCVTEWYENWEKNKWRTSTNNEVKNKDLIQAVREEIAKRDAAGTKTNFVWVKGHNSHPGNVAADGLAVAGASMGLPAKGRKKLK